MWLAEPNLGKRGPRLAGGCGDPRAKGNGYLRCAFRKERVLSRTLLPCIGRPAVSQCPAPSALADRLSTTTSLLLPPLSVP